MYYILHGHTPIRCTDLHTWSKWMELCDRKVEAEDVEVDGKVYTVSTVFLGIDHNFAGTGPPLVFETMVFRKGSWHGIYGRRYSTWIEAQTGHEVVASEVATGLIKEETAE